MPNPFVYGRDSTARIYFGNPPSPFDVQAKKIQAQEKANIQWDGVCGENRDRPMKITSGFTVSVDTFDDGTGAYLRNYIRAQANDDAGNAPIGLGAGLIFKSAGGVTVVTFGGIMVLDPLDYTVEGRGSANMAVVKINCQYMNPGPSVAV